MKFGAMVKFSWAWIANLKSSSFELRFGIVAQSGLNGSYLVKIFSFL